MTLLGTFLRIHPPGYHLMRDAHKGLDPERVRFHALTALAVAATMSEGDGPGGTHDVNVAQATKLIDSALNLQSQGSIVGAALDLWRRRRAMGKWGKR